MRLSNFLWQVLSFLTTPALIGTVYIYVYPLLHACSFPGFYPKPVETECWVDNRQVPTTTQLVTWAEKAPFRLLAFGDPQIEGDTSLPNPNAPAFPSLWNLSGQLVQGPLSSTPKAVAIALTDTVVKDVPALFQGYRKRLDLWGNDLYLRHVYRTLNWYSSPTHTVVLGDLLGSQWISDEEFDRRSERFWKKIFRGVEKVPDHIMGLQTSGMTKKHDSVVEVLEGSDLKSWKKRLIAVAGNHDIGYAGDMDDKRIARFEHTFGKVNWDIRFRLPSNESDSPSSFAFGTASHAPELRLVILNSMNLDSPAWQTHLQDETNAFLDQQIAMTSARREKDATILLTHLPLFKEEGVCIDKPFVTHFPERHGGGIREQNHLSRESSVRLLDGLFPSSEDVSKRRNGVIMNGHDHEGCDTFHYRNYGADMDEEVEMVDSWAVSQYPHGHQQSLVNNANIHGIREVTQRSMMGDFYGNAGYLSAWFNNNTQKWEFDYNSCPFAKPYIWWAVHGLDIFLVLLFIFSVAEATWEEWSEDQAEEQAEMRRKAQEKHKMS